jgi:3-methyladenine DNA glycosylase AlkC
MKQAIEYQYLFGTEENDKLKRASENCQKLAAEYTKQLLEDYTNRIIVNAFVTHKETSDGDKYIINKESITGQLELFKKEMGL